jgi:hypothetical protein
MVERVQTGGVMSFDYGKGRKREASEEQKKDIAIGYEEYSERKKREKRKMWVIILVIIVVLTGLSVLFLS